jgi:hypothetical protein
MLATPGHILALLLRLEPSITGVISLWGPNPMKPDGQRRMKELCARLVVERDSAKFTQVVTELNQLLEGKEDRLA